ncbi:hypothetical protein HOLleu_43742 [Holothuria leucospilota]|uniref:Uncharacterized protein n=1 Tax=Holothuria leucospilota TaxID=206669 RepID=A0A9Q0Y9C5_HOLLE|nr:hypothetical protein HOLleu_43742 [Holothuria leucospilota]
MLEHQACSLGCDTTSRLYRLGKGLSLKHIRTDVCFRAQAKVFLDGRSTMEDTAKAGESALVSLYKGSAGDTLDKLRLVRFQQKVATSASCVRPENLPPTLSAAKFHSLRVYHQVQVWKGVTTLDPQIFGWQAVGGELVLCNAT